MRILYIAFRWRFIPLLASLIQVFFLKKRVERLDINLNGDIMSEIQMRH